MLQDSSCHQISKTSRRHNDIPTNQQIHIPSNRGELSRICRIFGAGGSLDDEIKHLDRLFSECVASKPRHKDLELSPDEAPRPQVASSSSWPSQPSCDKRPNVTQCYRSPTWCTTWLPGFLPVLPGCDVAVPLPRRSFRVAHRAAGGAPGAWRVAAAAGGAVPPGAAEAAGRRVTAHGRLQWKTHGSSLIWLELMFFGGVFFAPC